MCLFIMQSEDSFLKVKVWPSDLTKAEFIESG